MTDDEKEGLECIIGLVSMFIVTAIAGCIFYFAKENKEKELINNPPTYEEVKSNRELQYSLFAKYTDLNILDNFSKNTNTYYFIKVNSRNDYYVSRFVISMGEALPSIYWKFGESLKIEYEYWNTFKEII